MPKGGQRELTPRRMKGQVPREAFREVLSELWPNRPSLPCEIVKSLRDVVAASLPPFCVKVGDGAQG